MEDLTKQQIVLLTLLVSFVTSLATGIFTVTLMDQGTLGITQVVNPIIEKEVVTTNNSAQTATVDAALSLSQAIAQVSKGIVRLKPANGNSDSVTGIGIILSPDGLIVTDKSALAVPGEETLGNGISAVLPGGQEVPIKLIQSEVIGDIAFAAILMPAGTVLSPVTSPSNASSIKLGDKVYALSGKKTPILEDGILRQNASTIEDRYDTSVSSKELLPGSPLFSSNGEIIGLKTLALKDSGAFYPFAPLRAIAPQLTR